MTTAIVSIGTEITRGELLDSNSQWLAERLSELGHQVVEMATVDDDEQRIGDTLRRLAARHRLIVATGGLGPTTDDLTTRAVARLLDVPLVRDAGVLQLLTERFAARGRAMAESNAKQADFPRGADILPNARGTAPGFAVDIDSARAFFMPGVPYEMKEMFDTQVVPRLPERSGHSCVIRLRTFGLPESEVNDRLRNLEEDYDVLLGYRATFPEIEVKVLAFADDRDEAITRARAAADAVYERLGPRIVYGEGTITLAEVVGDALTQLGWTLGLAESCTGGLVSELITATPGASAYYVGGVCSYANLLKNRVLGVGADTLGEFGAVSEIVARQMAEGARRRFECDAALAITGIAGPGGGTPSKPVGLVYWAVATPRGTVVHHRVFPGTRRQVQRLAAYAGLATLRHQLMASLDSAHGAHEAPAG